MLALTSSTGSGEVVTCHLNDSGLEGSPSSFRSILSPPRSPAPLMKSSLISASGVPSMTLSLFSISFTAFTADWLLC